MKSALLGTSMVALATALAAPAAFAADASNTTVSEVIVTGTRTTGVKAANSAAPIQVVGATALTKTGSTDLAMALTSDVPSLNIETNGGDIAALTIEANLRGLSPNDTLVLINGKRLHNTADLIIDTGSVYTGGSAADLSFIPIGAIDHVEVLTDGAAAQYGTDAIAGVMNIILKKSGSGGQIVGSGGQNYNNQGLTGTWSLNKGFELGDRGYVNFTVEQRYHEDTVEGFGDSRFQNPNGSLIPQSDPVNNGVTGAQNFPHENQLNGDPAFNIFNTEFNAAYDLGEGVEAYAFGTYGQRDARHYENYRTPNKVEGHECAGVGATCVTPGAGALVVPFPTGFDPQEGIVEQNYTFTGGFRGDLVGWHWDLSSTYGRDHNDIYVYNSANAQLFPLLQAQSTTPVVPQTTFYNGAFTATQWTQDFDVNKDFSVGLASPLNVAAGLEYRKDTFAIAAGEPSSYYGAGAQSFDGYTPLDQGGHSRNSYAGYVDLAVSPIAGLKTDLAGRYEHYSDFGSTTVGKFTARYDFNPMIAIRGTVSTGFRAPTLEEEFYSGTNVSPFSADVVLPPNSPAAALAGFASLKPEKSTNYSIGFVAHPMDRMQITVDLYQIDIRDRILESGFIYGTNTFTGPPTVVSQGVLNAIAAKGVTLDSGLSYTGISTFANAANTQTQGAEVTLNYASDFDQFGHVDWTLGFNYNATTIQKVISLPLVDQPSSNCVAFPTSCASYLQSHFGFTQTSFLTPNASSALTTANPKEKVILQANWSLDKFSVNLRESIYGPSAQWSANNALYDKINTTGITDVDIGYKFTRKLKFDIGANNLLNTIPGHDPGVSGGGRVYDVPYAFSPYGTNGGYYYGRFTYSF